MEFHGLPVDLFNLLTTYSDNKAGCDAEAKEAAEEMRQEMRQEAADDYSDDDDDDDDGDGDDNDDDDNDNDDDDGDNEDAGIRYADLATVEKSSAFFLPEPPTTMDINQVIYSEQDVGFVDNWIHEC